MPPLQQSIARGKAGATAQDACEPRPQHQAPGFVWVSAVRLEIGIEISDQLAHPLLGGSMSLREGVPFVPQPLGMDPAQRVPAERELTGVVTQHHGRAPKAVCIDAAPLSPRGGDLRMVLDDRHPGVCG